MLSWFRECKILSYFRDIPLLGVISSGQNQNFFRFVFSMSKTPLNIKFQLEVLFENSIFRLLEVKKSIFKKFSKFAEILYTVSFFDIEDIYLKKFCWFDHWKLPYERHTPKMSQNFACPEPGSEKNFHAERMYAIDSPLRKTLRKSKLSSKIDFCNQISTFKIRPHL